MTAPALLPIDTANESVWASWNGALMRLEEVRIPALDRGFLFGDAIYEVMPVRGGQIQRTQAHFERMERSLAAVDMPISASEVLVDIRRLQKLHPLEDGYVYVQITRGTAARRHRFPDAGTPPNVLVYLQPSAPEKMREQCRTGCRAITHPDLRWLRPDIKSTNLLANCLANQAAYEVGATEAILFDVNDDVTEGTHSNVFIVSDGYVKTPPLELPILPGITRKVVLEQCASLGIPTRIENFTIRQLRNADEVFLSNTTWGVMPVTHVDQKAIGVGETGETTRLIMQSLESTYDTNQVKQTA